MGGRPVRESVHDYRMSQNILRRRVINLYQRGLRNYRDWAGDLDVFYWASAQLRNEFEEHRNETRPEVIRELVEAGEARLEKLDHPAPYIRMCTLYFFI